MCGVVLAYLWHFHRPAMRRLHPWRAGLLGMRGAVGSDLFLFKQAAKEIKAILKEEGVAKLPLGVDVVEPPIKVSR